MKIQKISLTWFRGASEDVCLDTNGKSVVIYGDNASGKSSFADAFEFIVRNGKIEHLAHEYAKSERDLKNCLRNTSAPTDAEARATFEFDTGESVSVSMPYDRDDRFESNPSDFISDIQSWRIEQHLLRQNEIANFIEKTKTQKYSALLPLLGLNYFEQIARNISSIRSQIERESRLEYLNGVEATLREEILEHFPDLSEDSIRLRISERAAKYGISPFKDVFEVATKASIEVIGKEKDLAPDIQRAATAQRIMKINVIEDMNEFLKIYREADEIRDEVIEYKINILEESTKYAGIQEDETIECPACGRQISLTDFRNHITSELESLREYNNFKKTIEGIKLKISRKIEQIISFANSDVYFTGWLNSPSKGKAKESFSYLEGSLLRDPSKKWLPTEVISALSCIEFLFGEMKKDLGEEPKEATELLKDSAFFETALRITNYKNVKDNIEKINILLNDLDGIYSTISQKISERTRNTLIKITEDVRRIWMKLHPDEAIEEITLMQPVGSDAAIDVALKFYGKQQPSPRLTLSEGYRNSLGLSIFLAFANQGDSKDHPIIFDDIVSSLDRNHRGMIIDLFNDELADRQIILLTHDDTWYKSLLTILDRSKWKFFRLLPWQSPEVGIRLDPTHYTFDEVNTLLADNPRAAGNAVRAIMDTTLPHYVQKLELRLPYMWGPENDERMTHEILNWLITDGKGLYKIKNSAGEWEPHNNAISTWEEADKHLIAWANPPSHGGSIAPAEVKRLIEICQRALDYFKCPECETSVWRMKDGNRKLCKCGKICWN
jgi:energy-coupling factor transporter ATP-binding protein EcfA2